jgi:EAL domain-containing protein (putative c-di-GMP-specific phosphodiesterase class I)
VPLGDWVLHQACRQLYRWQQQQQVLPAVWMSVNLSVIQFSQPDLIGRIDQVLRQSQLSSRCLTLEITESAIIDNAERVERLFSQLKQRSIRLSIDDFGTGYSSLSYLHRFPVDSLKIDRSFIGQIDCDRKQAGIVAAILSLAQHLDMQVVAEGIEHNGQAQCLRQLGCQFGQGYLFSKPLQAVDLQRQLAFLRRPSA